VEIASNAVGPGGGGLLSVILEVRGSSGGSDVILINVLRVVSKSHRQVACNSTLNYVAVCCLATISRSLFIIFHPVLCNVYFIMIK
jgi:hypothetical protein